MKLASTIAVALFIFAGGALAQGTPASGAAADKDASATGSAKSAAKAKGSKKGYWSPERVAARAKMRLKRAGTALKQAVGRPKPAAAPSPDTKP